MLNALLKTQMIKDKALEIGFDGCGIAKAEKLTGDAEHLKQWLDKGFHGNMGYMENHFEKRVDPVKLVEGTKSIVSVILNYYPEGQQRDREAPVLSKYAYGEDYHFVMKRMLKQLQTFIDENIGECNGRAFVDSAPVLDRAWAARAGLGWIGKNTNLISSMHGSFVFIGSLFVSIDLTYDAPIPDYCGGCSKCMQACPTNAIIAPRLLDSSKCISYFTIEYKREQIPVEYKDKFKGRVFGCDICQDVCPWNRKILPHHVPEFQPSEGLMDLTKKEWMDMDKDKFKTLFKKSPVKRIKFPGLKRNIEFVLY